MRRRKLIWLAGVGSFATVAYAQQQEQWLARLLLRQPLAPEGAPGGNIALSSDRAISPDRYLKQLSPPKFARGHTLPPLTRFGWVVPFAANVEFAERWGYALDWGGYANAEKVATAMADPNSPSSKAVALAAADPARYKLFVVLDRALPTTPDTLWLRDASGKLAQDRQIWSPEAPVEALQAAAKLRADPLAQIRRRAPIAVVLNGGEYALSVLGAIQKDCEADPRVMAARGNRDWFDYLSERKAYQESFIAKAVRQVVPDRQMYVYYPADSNPHRGRYGGWNQWCYDYKYMRSITDRPSSSTYFKEFNTGWTGDMDLLTEVLNSVGQQIKFGDPLSYNWVCSGWMRDGNNPVFGDIGLYTGFLKCYYMAGMLGGIAGYFDYPKNGGFDANFAADSPPNWLLQMVALARVHALFSYLESYLRSGDLLPGSKRHVWSKDTPAYEFPTENPEVRVLVRKHRRQASWAIAAWAANGKSQRVSIDIPELGRVSVGARPIGSVYTVKKSGDRPKLTQFDV